MNYSRIIIPHARNVLKKISDVLNTKEGWFIFPNSSSDGRRNSQEGEDHVANYLLTHPSLTGLLVKKDLKSCPHGNKIISPDQRPGSDSVKKGITDITDNTDNTDNRAFGDIGINLKKFGYDEPFPCNIKLISECNKAGNNSCGLINLIQYTFQRPCTNHDKVMDILVDIDKSGYEKITPLLYGIIMVQKENKKCWVGTFDEVPEKSIGTNPSNPLQIPFLTDRVVRTEKEYITLLINKIVEYHTKKSRPLAIWNAYQNSKKE